MCPTCLVSPTIRLVQWLHFSGEENVRIKNWCLARGFNRDPGTLVRPAPDPREVFCRGADMRGLPPAVERGDASTDCSDMLDRLEAMEGALLSSTSPSSDSMLYPLGWVVTGGTGSLPGVVFLDTLLSLRNWSRNDICEGGLSPITARVEIIIMMVRNSREI